jgi:hypothetical protein
MVETKKEKKVAGERLGISGFTLGVVGIVLVLFSPIAGILSAITGAVFCIIQRKKNKTTLSKAGLILGIIGIILNASYIIIAVYWIFPYLQQQGLL